MTDQFAQAHRNLLAAIAREVAATSVYLGRDHLSPAVMAALGKVPRHEFVPDDLRHLAYQNRPLSIGHGQTISQPYIVAIMTQLAALTPQSHVLEIGTGCGYQAAVLAEIADRVVTVERIASLADEAKARLKLLGYDNITVIHGDGSRGWPAEAPYDAILVTAAAAKFDLCFTFTEEDTETGTVCESCNLPVAFVPLLGGLD